VPSTYIFAANACVKIGMIDHCCLPLSFRSDGVNVFEEYGGSVTGELG
jgi:hypothetical protein